METEIFGTTESRRLHILEPHEVVALYARPSFTSDERQHYFSLTTTEQATCAELRSLASQVAFILQLGYFKAKRLFFTFTFAEVADDVAAILSRHFPTAAEVAWEPLSEPTIRKQRTRTSSNSSTTDAVGSQSVSRLRSTPASSLRSAASRSTSSVSSSSSSPSSASSPPVTRRYRTRSATP